ncbi:MAG: hypothetical protein ACK4FV_00410 [Candidatus Nitrosocaldus sp.]
MNMVVDTPYHTISRLFPNLFPNYKVFEKCIGILGALEYADTDRYSLLYLYRKGLLYRLNATTGSDESGKSNNNDMGKDKSSGSKRSRYIYRPTPKCMIMMILSIPSFQDNKTIMNTLASNAYKGNRLALALILVGLIDSRDKSIYNTLVDYAKHHTIDGVEDESVADSLLEFISNRLEKDAVGVQGYINVLKDFTSSTLDSVLRVLIASIKPRVEDYNGFIQLMHEVVRFYYDPVRIAYMRIVEEREEFKARLEGFRKEHDISIIASSNKGYGSVDGKDKVVEVSFRLDLAHRRLASIPYYLQIMAFKLIVEPREFMLKEFERYIWGS